LVVPAVTERLWNTPGSKVRPKGDNLSGLSYGQLAELFLTYVMHSLNHRLYQMEPWLADHQTLIEQIIDWQFTSKDATDDRGWPRWYKRLAPTTRR